MIPLSRLPQLFEGHWLSRGDGVAQGASIDTRTLEPGQIFFALPGTRVDGHDYLYQAAKRGASVAVVEREVALPDNLATFHVRDVQAAMWALSSWYRSTLRARVVAVMGSNGKTTTVRMLMAVLSQAMRTHASQRSFNNALGLPLTILNCPVDADALVCELGEGEPGALVRYAGLARPDFAVVTSVGRAHVGELGGIEAVQAEFRDALREAPPECAAFVPERDARLHERGRVTFAVSDARHTSGGTEFMLSDGSRWSIPVVGLHNASNAAAVIAVGRHLGIADDSIQAGLRSFEPADMRLAVREIGGATVLVDCYNANPDSMAAALRTLAEVGANRQTVAIVGDMLELGEDSDAWHREMGRLARASADVCVFIGPASRSAFEAADEGVWFESVEAAQEAFRQHVCPGAVVLLKASRSMALERLLDALQQASVA